MKPPGLIKTRLQVKFLLLLLTLLVFLTILITFVFVNYEVSTQQKNLLNESKAFSSLSVRPIGSAYSTYFDSGFLKFKEITDNTLALDTNINKIQIISVEGQVLYDSSSTATNTSLAESLVNAVNSSKETVINQGGQVSEIIEPYFDDFGAHSFSIRYFVSASSLRRAVTATLPLVLLIVFTVAIIAGGTIALLVRRTILSPINQISQAASLVSGGNLEARISVRTGDELEKLALAVNNMASSLQKNIEDLKELDKLKDEFIIIASHNLRTPVTVLKGFLAQLGADKRFAKTLKEPLSGMNFATSQLEGLIEEFINIVSLEQKRNVQAESEVNIVTIVQEVIDYYAQEAAKKKVSLQLFTSGEKLPVFGDATKLKVLFSNIVENAVKFNREGGSVKIKIEGKGDQVLISFKDTGIGIAEKEVPLVFKKFHRATDILQYNYQGLGLGLYLARVIAEAHKGKIWFESKVNEGSTFFVTLPILSRNSNAKEGEG